MPAPRTSILFTGYAPVHFVCFQPLYERLLRSSEYDVFLSGGLRSEGEDGVRHDAHAMYEQFGVPAHRVLPVEEIQTRDFDVLFAANTKLIEPRSVGTRVQIFHGVSFRNKSVRDENMGCDHYFVIGPYQHRKFVEGGLLAPDDPRAVKVGFMKTDPLRAERHDRQELLRRVGLDGSRPILLYAPTGQRHNSLETMGEAVIRHLAVTGRYDILIKLHDHPKDTGVDWPTRLSPFEDEHTRVTRERDIVPLMLLADLLISDASSVTSEFALLDRPMVFLDVPLLLEKAAKSGALDTETWGRRAGVVVKSPEKIAATVERALADPTALSDVRRAMADDLFYNPGRATDVAMAWIESRAPRNGLAPLAGPAHERGRSDR
ncbi:MAG TPA: CDP-glycerol glycerophosphotransferase family protein [Planctomycetota bacterium]|nr:CDP-glycerol glycerophosphotransferase family protein [Planctomycetota bacterium]